MQLLTSSCPIHSYSSPIGVLAGLQCCLWSLQFTDAGLAAAAGLRVLQLLLLDQVCKQERLVPSRRFSPSRCLLPLKCGVCCTICPASPMSTRCTVLAMLQTCAAAPFGLSAA